MKFEKIAIQWIVLSTLRTTGSRTLKLINLIHVGYHFVFNMWVEQ